MEEEMIGGNVDYISKLEMKKIYNYKATQYISLL